MNDISCSVCNKIFKEDEYFWFDDTTEEYFCYNCRSHLNKKHNIMYVKINEEGNLKIINIGGYAAGPISTKEWIVYDFDEFYKNHTSCPHALEDLYNHIPVFSQEGKFYCCKCYESLKDKHGECIVYLDDNKIRSLHHGFFPYSNIDFTFSTNKIKEDEFNINVSIKNLKNSDIKDLNIYLFSFSKDLEVDEDEIEWFFEIPDHLANLVLFEKFHLNVLNSKDTLNEDFIIKIPKNNSLETLELTFKNNWLYEKYIQTYNFYNTGEIKKLISDLPLDIYIVTSFKTNYGVYQSHIEKLTVE